MAERIADIERARRALAQQAWADAYDELHELDPAGLTAPDLEGLADAAWWLCRLDESIAARTKAYASYAASGDDRRAGTVATRLCIEHFIRGEPSVGAGWLARAQRHIREVEEGVEHGFLALVEGTIARFGNELDRALELARRATEIGRRVGDPDLTAMAVHTEGLVLVAAGRAAEGVALLDEAMTSVVAGELTDYYTGVIYCGVIDACLQVADVRRAGEWSEAARTWCDSLSSGALYPGLCRVNRAEVASLTGAWVEAEAEAARASDELMSFDPRAAAAAFYQTGDIRRRMGDVEGAEASFGRAHELGLDPQPGLALLRLAQGRGDAAHTVLRIALAGEPGNPLRRARLLAAQVEVAIAVADLETARRASDELQAIAGGFQTPAPAAQAAEARGAVRLADGDVAGALESLRRAVSTWRELRLPYETARARMRYGLALREAGDEEDAVLELRAALSAFEGLRAAPDARAASALLSRPSTLPGGLTAREAEVLRLVAAGKTNREIAAELFISEHTVARHLQNMFAKLRVSSRSGATAFAFEHGLARRRDLSSGSS